MKNSRSEIPKEESVTLIPTESTSSLLSQNVPYLDDTHPTDSRICIINEKQLRNTLNKRKQNSQECEEGTSIQLGNNRIKINSEAFPTNNCLSLSDIYDSTDSDASEREISSSISKELFRETDIVFCPLLSARNSDSQLSSDSICRICHGGDSTGDLVTPCRCRGTIALVHMKCLETWLTESNNSECELCQHHYETIREPKYSVPGSILVFLRSPGDHLDAIILDLISLIAYTPTAVSSAYMLLITCESIYTHSFVTAEPLSSQIMMYSAALGLITIGVAFSSWLLSTFQKHVNAWRNWYSANSHIKVILPERKPHERSRRMD